MYTEYILLFCNVHISVKMLLYKSRLLSNWKKILVWCWVCLKVRKYIDYYRDFLKIWLNSISRYAIPCVSRFPWGKFIRSVNLQWKCKKAPRHWEIIDTKWNIVGRMGGIYQKEMKIWVGEDFLKEISVQVDILRKWWLNT